MTQDEVQKKVIEVLSQALDRRPENILMHQSLVDDLGAESIDFLDIRFRVEQAFRIKIPEDELWEGSLQFEAPGLIGPNGLSDEGLSRLKTRMPDFAWSRFPRGVSKADLPRLITPGTIVEYLQRRLEGTTGS